jgi:Spx/MgsR family transcriptional regulator
MPIAKKSSPARARKPAGRAKKPAKTAKFFQLDTCSTCRKARSFLEKRGFKLRIRDLRKNKLSVAELEKLIGPRDHEDFLNARSEIFQENHMGDNPPTRRKAISFMAKYPTLIRRPIVVAGGRVVVGFDENGMTRL